MPVLLCLGGRHTFGIKRDVSHGVHYLDDHTLLYASGYDAVVYDAEQHTQTLLRAVHDGGAAGSRGISALAISPSRKRIAVAEQGTVSIFDAMSRKRRKSLSCADVQGGAYISITFSPDGKLLLALVRPGPYIAYKALSYRLPLARPCLAHTSTLALPLSSH
eukprot:scaffold2162_cov398-Prasinococcus_capsulatus_cf.AAC.14